MFHNQHVSHIWHVFVILFFMSCPDPPLDILGVGSFSVLSGGSLIIFQLFRCRNLALNRMFSYIRGRPGGCQHRGHLYTPIHSYAPHTSVCPHTPCTSVCFSMFPTCCGDLGASVHPICLVFWVASVHLSDILLSVSTSICLSVNISHASCCPPCQLLHS